MSWRPIINGIRPGKAGSHDSALEGTGFELSVPRQLAAVSRPSLVPRKRRARCRRGAVALLRNRKFADSPLEEDGFNSRSHREGKGYGEPLQASIAVSDLNL